MRKWAIRTRYLTSRYTSDGKRHSHTTKWFDDSEDAWNEKERWESSLSNIIVESASSLIHKEVK